MTVSAKSNICVPIIVLFPNQLLFPVNPTHIFKKAFGISPRKIVEDLTGAILLYPTGQTYKITKVTIKPVKRGALGSLLNVLFVKDIQFQIFKEEYKEDFDRLHKKFLKATFNLMNNGTIRTHLTENQFLKIETSEELYRAYIIPDISDCLDTL